MKGLPRQGFVGVGANVGDRWATIRKARGMIASIPGVAAVEMSPVFETMPVGGVAQPPFLNLVFGVETSLAPDDLLTILLEIERIEGRDRSQEVRWGPRLLDLDILVFEGSVRSAPHLTLPHPRMWERSFVLIPLKALLDHSSRFTPARWAQLVPLLQSIPDDPGVRPWSPPSA